ncbi:MAG TPA: hypothetical protein VKM55_23520 [Candidatus Lokiarchaeia archaeon]|nr:hypothetical protein [Candidatus Lokiarchaeia archaeon]
MPSKYPECDLCPASNCEDEKLKQVLDDPDFTKAFVNNLLVSNIDEITKDSYFMAEVISERTDPVEIADFAFCIYVTLSQLVEMPLDKRMEIAVVFRQEFDHMAEEASKVRQIAKKVKVSSSKSSAKVTQAKRAPIQAQPVQIPSKKPVKSPAGKALPAVKPVTAAAKSSAATRPSKESNADTEKFLAELDQDIADIETLSGNVDKIIQTTPATSPEESESLIEVEAPVQPERKKTKLEPVIGKLAGKPVAIGATVAKPKPAAPRTPRQPELGSKANPIKLTPEMLEGSISEKDMARVDKGIKIKRVDTSKFSSKPTAPHQIKLESQTKPAKHEKMERIDRSSEKEKALSQELFTAFQQIKTKEQRPNTFTLNTLGVGAGEKSKESIELNRKKNEENVFLTDLLKLSPDQKEKKEPEQASPAKTAIGNLTLDFDEEEEKQVKPKRKK